MLGKLLKWWHTIRLYNKYYKRTGLYHFIFRNAFKLIGIILVLLLVFFLIERYIIDFDVLFKDFLGKLKWYYVIIVFFISETFLGLIPPDLFIIWSKQFPNQYLIVTYLAVISYVGGYLAFEIGKLIYKIPKINNYINSRFLSIFINIKKWGSILIIVAALFPLPFSTICLIAGIVKFPRIRFLLFALTRILRFFIYAFFLFHFF